MTVLSVDGPTGASARVPSFGAKDFLTLAQLDPAGLAEVLDVAERVKADPGLVRGRHAGRMLGLIFEKPSTRTRVSFEAAAWLLGMLPVTLGVNDLQLGRGETIGDTARTLSLYVDAVAIRTFGQDRVDALAQASAVPVINALSDAHHPCQALADLLTIREEVGALAGVPVAFIGDGDNVCASLVEAAALTGLDLRIATPPGYEPDPALILRSAPGAERLAGGVRLTHDPRDAVDGARVVYADVWTSMGHEIEQQARRVAFAGFRVDDGLLRHADADVVFLHCLPAHRGEEVTDDVIDGARSRVWQQARNRLPTEAVVLDSLLTRTPRQ